MPDIDLSLDVSETVWQQYDRLSRTPCDCGHALQHHGDSPGGGLCLVSRCGCDDATVTP